MGEYWSSTFLVALPSVTSGVARLLDVAGTFDEYNQSRSPEEADLVALGMDWVAVGADLHGALAQVTLDEVREPV